MAQSKRVNSWWTSSFDFEQADEQPSIKRASSQTLRPNLSEDLITYDIIPKKRNTSNLSALLAACNPQNPSELVISRQKQQEISNWLRCKVRKGWPSALVLSGSSGCGKTVAIRLLAKENGFDVVEWVTPIDQAMDENNRVMRQGDRFEDFLVRATRYSSVLSNESRRLLLVKDFPNVYYEDKDSFLILLTKYFEIGKEPIVFVCTETENSRLLQTLFAPEVREKFGIDLININPVTQASTKNALKRISGILNKIAGHMMNVTQYKIDEILSSSIGDIRNALLNLIFISLKVPEVELKNECKVREESLGLLHGVGRVINPKRTQDGSCWKFVHDPDDIAAYFQSQATIFLRFLQENYLNTMRGMEEVNVCADILSTADVLTAEWRDPSLTKVTLSFCIRGVMVKNEKPVSGWNPVRKPQSDRIHVMLDGWTLKASLTPIANDVRMLREYKSSIRHDCEMYVSLLTIFAICPFEHYYKKTLHQTVKSATIDAEITQRCLAAAEVRWYESIIKPKPKRNAEELPHPDIEEIIE